MAIREIEPWPNDGYGLDFGEFWKDANVVRGALWKLAAGLQPAVCYCLRLDAVHGGISWFRPYEPDGLITNVGIELPTGIRYDRLLDIDDRWPSLAEWIENDKLTAQHPPELESAVWFGQVKLKSGDEFVGYFKAAVCTGEPPLDDFVRDAYRQTKFWLDAVISERRQSATWNEPQFKESLASTHQEIQRELLAGKPAVAIQRLATLITSHLTAGFNRIICMTPDKTDLKCIYAHGGDCSDDWSRRIQRPLSEQIRTIPELQAKVAPSSPPLDDCLYRDLVGGQGLSLIGVRSSRSIIARLWENGGDLENLDPDNAVEGDPFPPDLANSSVRVGGMPNIAAKVTFADPLFEQWRSQNPGSPLFQSRNGAMFAIPWLKESQLLAIWLVDLGFWFHYDRRDVVPRLLIAKAVLAEFAEDFAKQRLS